MANSCIVDGCATITNSLLCSTCLDTIKTTIENDEIDNSSFKRAMIRQAKSYLEQSEIYILQQKIKNM
jgi:hypothetical protein